MLGVYPMAILPPSICSRQQGAQRKPLTFPDSLEVRRVRTLKFSAMSPSERWRPVPAVLGPPPPQGPFRQGFCSRVPHAHARTP